MLVTRLDHLVLTVRDIDETLRFYESVLGMEPVVFGEGRVALRFGNQKINLHSHIESRGVQIIEGPVGRTGATGEIRSVCFRDPSGNLIELANEVGAA